MTENAFQEKRRRRADNLKSRARSKRAAANQLQERTRTLAGVMNGQPILIGHHSERRHRRDLDRMQRDSSKALQLTREADELERRASAAESNRAISSDDPQAREKIQAKITKLEATRDRAKKINAAVRKARRGGDGWEECAHAALVELGVDTDKAHAFLQPDFAGRYGVPGYVLTNAGAEVRRLRKRLASLDQATDRAGREEEHGDVQIVEVDNRVRIVFPSKPDEGTRRQLKAAGFKWARSVGAWQRHASELAWDRARAIVGVTSV